MMSPMARIASAVWSGPKPWSMGEYPSRSVATLPNDPDRLRALITTALQAGKNDDARAAAEQLVRLQPNNVRARLLHGDICKKLKDEDGAVDAYETAAFLYEAEGFFLKSIAVRKHMIRL